MFVNDKVEAHWFNAHSVHNIRTFWGKKLKTIYEFDPQIRQHYTMAYHICTYYEFVLINDNCNNIDAKDIINVITYKYI